jgi:hypothetical protein
VLVGRVGTFSAVVGAVYGLGSTGGRFGAALIGTFDGLTIGLALAAIGTFILDAPVGAPVRRLPVSAAMSLRASIYVLVIAGGLQLGETLSSNRLVARADRCTRSKRAHHGELLLLIALFYHLRFGLPSVMEDFPGRRSQN